MKTVSLGNLLSAISTAIAGGQESLRRRHLGNFHSNFKRTEDGTLTPSTIPVRLPRDHFEKDDDPSYRVAQIPLATLTHHDQVYMDEMVFELDCLIEDFDDKDGDGNGSLSLVIGSGIPRREGSAKLSVTFKREATPEGIARTVDALHKHSDEHR